MTPIEDKERRVREAAEAIQKERPHGPLMVVDEIARRAGLSYGTAYTQVQVLVGNGTFSQIPGMSRSIRVVKFLPKSRKSEQ